MDKKINEINMMSLFEFSRTLTKFNQEKKFDDAINYFNDNKSTFSLKEIASNDYLVSAVITALRYTNNIDKAFKFLEDYNININEDTNPLILTSYGWLLYDKFKTENHHINFQEIEVDLYEEEVFPDKSEKLYNNKLETIIQIVEFLPIILKINNVYTNSLFSKLFNIIPKIERKRKTVNWELIDDFCKEVHPDCLRIDCESRKVNRNGKIILMEYASDRENWYAYRSKALFELGRFQECCEISQQALESFQKFHYSNDIWFAMRIALSKKHLGNSEDAITELLQILKRKQEWFIEMDLAELYKEKGDTETALKFAVQAINNSGRIETKVDLIYLLGEILESKKEADLSFKHFSLSRLIRIKERWIIPIRLSSKIDQFGKENIPLEKFTILKYELTNYWRSYKSQKIETRKEVFKSKFIRGGL